MVNEDQQGNTLSLKRKRNTTLNFILSLFYSLKLCNNVENEVEVEESASPSQSLGVKEDLSKSKREKKDSKNNDVMVMNTY